MLTKDSVSVLRQQFLNFNGEEMQVGGNIRNAYMNSKSGREQLKTVLCSVKKDGQAVSAMYADRIMFLQITQIRGEEEMIKMGAMYCLLVL